MAHLQETIAFLLFDDVEELDFVGPFEMFQVWSSEYGGPTNVITISQNAVVRCSHGLQILTNYSFANCPSRIDYLVIPGGRGTRSQINNEEVINFIRTAFTDLQCKYILSVCTGVFLLEKAGLLRGQRATTHWASLERLRDCDKVEVIEERVVRNNNIWTSSGISSGMDMALQFIEFIDGAEFAGKVQLWTEYYPEQKIYGDIVRNKKRAPKYLRSKL